MPQTLFDKIWETHEVAHGLLYIDLHLVHEVTSPQAFDSLRMAGRPVRRPDRTLATADHNTPTDGTPIAARIKDELSRHTLAPRGATGAVDGEGGEPLHEPGSRETALVERGSVVLVCDGQRHELREDDCVTFDADLPHHFENPTTADAAFLAVVSAGLRRS